MHIFRTAGHEASCIGITLSSEKGLVFFMPARGAFAAATAVAAAAAAGMKTIATQPLDSPDRPTDRPTPPLRSASPPHLSAESLGNVLSFSPTASPTLSCTSSLFPIHPAASTVASGVRPHQSRLFCPSPLSLHPKVSPCYFQTSFLPRQREILPPSGTERGR